METIRSCKLKNLNLNYLLTYESKNNCKQLKIKQISSSFYWHNRLPLNTFFYEFQQVFYRFFKNLCVLLGMVVKLRVQAGGF